MLNLADRLFCNTSPLSKFGLRYMQTFSIIINAFA